MKKLLFFWKSNAAITGLSESMEPRGVHHTVSYATSYEETWGHIRDEVRSTRTNIHSLASEKKVLA